MKLKVLLTRKLHDFAIRELKKRCQVEINRGKIPMPKNRLISRIKDKGDRVIRNNKWMVISGAYDFLGVDLYGKTLGIFGMGRIGKAVAKRARGFEMNILYHNRNKLPNVKEKSLGVKYASLDRLFTTSDVISIHVPYTKETHHLVNLKLLKKMKRTAFLINTARGKIVNEKDLVFALKKKIIAGTALDVYQNEPINKTHPLARMENVVVTPHIGSSTYETRSEMSKITVQNLILSLFGKKPIYVVNSNAKT